MWLPKSRRCIHLIPLSSCSRSSTQNLTEHVSSPAHTLAVGSPLRVDPLSGAFARGPLQYATVSLTCSNCRRARGCLMPGLARGMQRRARLAATPTNSYMHRRDRAQFGRTSARLAPGQHLLPHTLGMITLQFHAYFACFSIVLRACRRL